MKWISVLVSIAVLFGAAITIPVWAQEMQQSKLGNDVISQRSRHFNPKTVEAISGRIVQVDRVASQGRRFGKGVHLSVATAEETVDVHLGPSWYLDDQKFNLKSGDQVEVIGSRVTDASKPSLIAAQVKSGDTMLNLRDESGFPVWSGQGRRGGMGRGGMGTSQWRGAQ